MANEFDYQILEAINNAVRTVKAAPLNLGAIAGSGGGIGGPPGGYVLYLPQTKVAYDFDEAAMSGFVEPGVFDDEGVMVSGSLLDNLNHIRYRLRVLESGASITIVDDNEAIDYYDIGSVHFSGAGITVVDLGEGEVQVVVSATGSGGAGSGVPLTVDEWDADPVITNTSHITFSGAVVVSELDDGHALIEILTSGVSDFDLTVRESDNSPSVSNVDNIAFSGAIVQNLGGGNVLVIVPSGSSVGTFLDLTDTPNSYVSHSGELVIVNDNETGLEFLDISTLIEEDTLHYYNDDLSDQVPGSIFITTKTYISGTLRFYYNGVRQRKSINYIDDQNFITFSTYFPTYSGDVIIVDYDYLLSENLSGINFLTDSEGAELLDSDGILLVESE